jgi:hypothetical protein
VLDDKPDIAARPFAHPFTKIFARTGWALALARRQHVRCRGRAFAATLPITPVLLLPARTPALTGPITPARLHATPTPSGLPATFTAIPCLRMTRLERLFAAFEKTTPTSTGTTRLLPRPPEMLQ